MNDFNGSVITGLPLRASGSYTHKVTIPGATRAGLPLRASGSYTHKVTLAGSYRAGQFGNAAPIVRYYLMRSATNQMQWINTTGDDTNRPGGATGLAQRVMSWTV